MANKINTFRHSVTCISGRDQLHSFQIKNLFWILFITVSNKMVACDKSVILTSEMSML